MKNSIFVLVLVGLAACKSGGATETKPAEGGGGASAKADIVAKSGSSVSGKATFTEVAGGVQVVIEVSGATPGSHATHIHEKGDCSAEDAASAGGHFNPAQKEHGIPPAAEHHLGDLGNIEIDAEGKGRIETMVEGANLTAGDPNSFVGKAIIVHEKVDTGEQPTGNAGGRVGCGEIS